MATLCHLDGNAAATDRAVRFLGEEHDDRRCDGGGDGFRRIRWSGAAVPIRGLVDVEEVERLVGDGEADLTVLVVEVRLADR